MQGQQTGQLIRAKVTHISKPYGTKQDSFKKLVYTLETRDGQVLFVDVLKGMIPKVQNKGIKIGSIVEVEYFFRGLSKGDKVFNNIYLKNMELYIPFSKRK